MYLKNIIIRNTGPIEKIDIELPFSENGNPKPIIFVGENGSGKTILLSSIVDALHEIEAIYFNDVCSRDDESGERFFYKLNGSINTRINKPYSLSFLKFTFHDKDKEFDKQYIDKSGTTNIEVMKDISDLTTIDKLKSVWESGENMKQVINNDKNDKLREDLLSNSYCYFPANRFENPHWININKHDKNFHFAQNIYDKLRKPIVVCETLENNKNWILDVILDARVDIKDVKQKDSKTFDFKISYLDAFFTSNSSKGKDNINKILKSILGDSLSLSTNQRGRLSPRLMIVDKSSMLVLPGLDNLSLGESTLFNMFLTIMRYSDVVSIDKILNLGNIEGIVVVDEIDLHLHAKLQNEVLPNLIKLFPKVQFIITTHSPLFLLGMEKEFGENAYEIRELPSGNKISVERFSEFGKAYEYFKNTKTFEKDMEEILLQATKPTVFVEGPTDVQYIKKAAEIFQKNYLEQIDIKIIGEKAVQGTKYSNNDAMHSAYRFIKSHPEILSSKVLLLFDPEEENKINKYEDIPNKLCTRNMPKIETNPIKKGIENLFEEKVISEVRKSMAECFDCFNHGGIEQKLSITGDKKQQVCNHICCEYGVEDVFSNFQSLLSIIENAFCLS